MFEQPSMSNHSEDNLSEERYYVDADELGDPATVLKEAEESVKIDKVLKHLIENFRASLFRFLETNQGKQFNAIYQGDIKNLVDKLDAATVTSADVEHIESILNPEDRKTLRLEEFKVALAQQATEEKPVQGEEEGTGLDGDGQMAA